MEREAEAVRSRAIVRHVLAALGLLASLAVLIPVALVMAPFWLVTASARALSRWLEPETVAWDQLIEYEPELGWKPKANLRCRPLDLAGDSFKVTTGEDGWRGRTSLEDADVAVFGDSFAFGYGVDDPQFFADLLSRPRIKAMGAPGYSMVQPVIWIERLGSRLAGKLVVLLVYLGNDLGDTLEPSMGRYRSPFVRVGPEGSNCEVVSWHVTPEPFSFSGRSAMDSYIEICRPGFVSRRVFAAAEYLMRRAKKACERSGAWLTVLTIPELSPSAREALRRRLAEQVGGGPIDEMRPEREIAAIGARLGVRVVPLREHLDTGHYLERDFHWSPSGHVVVAEVLRTLWKETPGESRRPVLLPRDAARGAGSGAAPAGSG